MTATGIKVRRASGRVTVCDPTKTSEFPSEICIPSSVIAGPPGDDVMPATTTRPEIPATTSVPIVARF